MPRELWGAQGGSQQGAPGKWGLAPSLYSVQIGLGSSVQPRSPGTMLRVADWCVIWRLCAAGYENAVFCVLQASSLRFKRHQADHLDLQRAYSSLALAT